jgi:2-polyprenyl-3-methyl-5-hydroxy-6-metoxy-1,4-benzoquinol methylase/predicted NUDIX family phosphoesterase
MPKKLSDHPSAERILVFDARDLSQIGASDGVCADYQTYIDFMFMQDRLRFQEPQATECDNTYKQIVSYVLVKYKNKLLRFIRSPDKTKEKPVYVDGHYSIGFRGQVLESDQDIFSFGSGYSVYENSVKRIVREKIGVEIDKSGYQLQTMGVLIDNSTSISKQKIAFIHLLDIEEPLSPNREKTSKKPRFVDFSEISKNLGDYEFWSILCLQAFYPNKLEIKTTICVNHNLSLYNQARTLLVVGQIGSGKSEACKILGSEYGYLHISCSGILKRLIGYKTEDKIERKVMQDKGYDFISQPRGHEELAAAILEYMLSHPSEKYVIDGLRYPETLSTLKKMTGRIITLVYVQSHIKNRFRLYHLNHDPSDDISDFLRITNHPVESEIVRFRPDADIVIYNHGSLDSYTSSLREFFRSELTDEFLRESWNLNAPQRHEQLIEKVDISFWYVLLPKIIEVIKGIKNSTSFNLLDVGCGTGVLSLILSEHVHQVVGIDPSEASIRKAEEGAENSEKVSYHCITVEEYSDQCKTPFDCIVAHMALQTTKRLDSAFLSMNRLLKEDGILIFTIPHPAFNPIRKKKLFPKSIYRYSEAAFYKIPFTITKDRQPLPSLVPYFHRPLQEYAEAIHSAGLFIQVIFEPGPDTETITRYSKDDWVYPHFLMFVCRKSSLVPQPGN